MSRLTQARGLKPDRWPGCCRARRVAPHAGAWIETSASMSGGTRLPGSRLTQARGLKPGRKRNVQASQLSRLTQARGLKLSPGSTPVCRWPSRLTQARGLKRHPAGHARQCMRPSRLTQARGLKLFLKASMRVFLSSRLTQARGLKRLLLGNGRNRPHVAPHAGAWIETIPELLKWTLASSRASRRRVD